MNNAKICIPVCAARADELISGVKAASERADVIEVRFDSLDPDQLYAGLEALEKLKIETPLLATFRPIEEGGNRALSFEDRRDFWQRIPPIFAYVDLELDVVDLYGGSATVIVSHHDHDTRPADLDLVVAGFGSGPKSILKIAKSVSDATDAIPIWNLIPIAMQRAVSLVPIAMGEAGKWTRILGPAYGSPLAYSKPLSDHETAAGQIAASEMTALFGVKELDRQTSVYGVVGDPVAGSLSPYMHNTAFRRFGINAVFIPFLVKDLAKFIARMVRAETKETDVNVAGLSVTMPYKRSIMPYLDEIDDTAGAIGAVNTVKIENGKLYGFNTDAKGFIEPLKIAMGDLKGTRVKVLGGGGAARACIFALKNEGANVSMIVRNSEKYRSLADDLDVNVASVFDAKLAGVDILVNATPVGMKGSPHSTALFTAKELAGVKLVYDLVPSSEVTALMCEANLAGAMVIGGLDMLASQGAEQFRIWTGIAVPTAEMKGALPVHNFSRY